MARRLNVTDGYALINAMADEMLGKNGTIQAIDASTFASVGETIMNSGIENVMNTLSIVCSRNLVAVRPYSAKFRLINPLDSGEYSSRVRKISFYAKNAVPTGNDNTQLKTNLAMGYDNGTNSGNSTGSQWEQSAPVPLELNFGGGVEWQYPYTIYEDQIKIALKSPEEWTQFLNGFLVACENDMETEKEAFSRMIVLNMIAGTASLTASMPGSVVNLTAAYNTKFGTSYTTAQLLTTYFSDFLAFFVSTVKTVSDKLENRSTLYHWSPTKTVGGVSYVLPRQTNKSDQKMFMISEFWNDAEARVMPALFNDQYLKLDNFEKVDYWQNINDPFAIKFKPAIPDVSTPSAQTAPADAVSLPKVLGVLFDRDACMADFQLEKVRRTSIEARKGYSNVWNTIRKNPINDFTENCVIFIMADA